MRFYFLNSLRMLDISVENYKNAEVHTITIGNRKLFWVKMNDVKK